MPVVFIIAIAVVLASVYVAATGRGGEMAYAQADHAPLDLGPVSAADVALLRPPTALWGYNMQVTDEALDRIARAIRERDVRIAVLQQQIADLEPGAVHAVPYGTAAGQEYADSPYEPAPGADDPGYRFMPGSGLESEFPTEPEPSYLPEAGDIVEGSYAPGAFFPDQTRDDPQTWPGTEYAEYSTAGTDPELPPVLDDPDSGPDHDAEPEPPSALAVTAPDIAPAPAAPPAREAAPDPGTADLEPPCDPEGSTPPEETPTEPQPLSEATTPAQTPLVLKASARKPLVSDPAEQAPTEPSPIAGSAEATQPSPVLPGAAGDDPQAPYDTQGPQGSYDTHGWWAQQQEAAQGEPGKPGPEGGSAEEAEERAR